MNYDLMRTVQGPIEVTTDQGLPYGDMPSSMLMTKFEETNMGDEDGLYNNYARNTITDWTADKNLLEHEEARGAVDRRAGYLNLIHTGDRSGIDPALVYRSEYFDGFLGPEDRDPRGINTDPDFKELTRQEQARMRFVRFSAENYDQITGGGRSEFQTMADQQKLFRVTRDRLKVFDRQLDGRREGIRRTYKNESAIKKQVIVQSYGDYIKDYALNPQRRAVVICKQVLRDTREWRDNTTDTDFAFAKYTQLRRAVRDGGNRKSRVNESAVDGKAIAPSEDGNKYYKAAGILMANIIQAKKSAKESMQGDIDMAADKGFMTRKTEPFQRDLTAILRSMSIDSDFAVSEKTQFGKTPTPQVMDHLARQVVFNHMLPAHHALNAEVIYKSVKPGADTRKIKDLVVYDNDAVECADMLTSGRKIGHSRAKTGMKTAGLEDTDRGLGSDMHVVNYKVVCKRRDNVLKYAVDDLTAESAMSQFRRPGKAGYKNPSADDQHTDMRYSDNDAVSCGGGMLGNKYMTRFVDRDGDVGSIAGDN